MSRTESSIDKASIKDTVARHDGAAGPQPGLSTPMRSLLLVVILLVLALLIASLIVT